MWVIAALSVAALAVVIERLIFFASASSDSDAVLSSFSKSLRERDERDERDERGERDERDKEVVRSAISGGSSLHRLLGAAYSQWGMDGGSVKLAAESAVRGELYRWERNMPLLEIASKIAPLLGLLGTVLGMVEMFRTLNIGGSVNAAAVTGGIWKALFTTVAGLSVAVPVIIAHGLLSGLIDRQEETLENAASFVLLEHARMKKKPGPCCKEPRS
ncbi:MAG: MotA/TolQ/ExbB proton channel family protein [Synergistaceae bacterium]|nr:MotA/TolQ/ExbB proton channel family protein [Synergistaceae bacterium]